MSVEAETWAWQQEGIAPLAKFILIALANRADEVGVCWPGIRGLASRLLVDERTVRRHIAELTASGLLTNQPRYREDGTQTSNLYKLCMTPATVPTYPGRNERVGGQSSVRGRGATAPPQEQSLEQSANALSSPPVCPPQEQAESLPPIIPAWAARFHTLPGVDRQALVAMVQYGSQERFRTVVEDVAAKWSEDWRQAGHRKHKSASRTFMNWLGMELRRTPGRAQAPQEKWGWDDNSSAVAQERYQPVATKG